MKIFFKNKIIILIIILFLLAFNYPYFWPNSLVTYGSLDQTFTLKRGQLLKIFDEGISVRIVDFDATGCPPGAMTDHECTDVFIKLKTKLWEYKCSMWMPCHGYEYRVNKSDFKTYADIEIYKDTDNY